MEEQQFQIMQVDQYSAMEAINRSEIDIQIKTAKAFPRDLAKFQSKLISAVKSSKEVAQSCFYSLSRKGKNGEKTSIDGPSVRLAEIALSEWTNCRAAAQVVGITDTQVIARAVFFDIEKNLAVVLENRRGILTSDGRKFSQDMINVTGQAACAVGLRNVVFKGIPQAFIREAYLTARAVAIGNEKNLVDRFRGACEQFKQRWGITKEQIFARLEISSETLITPEHILELLGIFNAIDGGESDVAEEFGLKPENGNGKPKTPQPQPAQVQPTPAAPANTASPAPAAAPAPQPAPAAEPGPAAPEVVEAVVVSDLGMTPPPQAPAQPEPEKPTLQMETVAAPAAEKKPDPLVGDVVDKPLTNILIKAMQSLVVSLKLGDEEFWQALRDCGYPTGLPTVKRKDFEKLQARLKEIAAAKAK